MEFSSLFFLYGLLPVVLLVYFLFPDVGRRNSVLIGVSFLLYGLCQPFCALLLFLMSRLNFRWGLRIRRGKRKTILVPVLCNILAIVLLRYVDPVLMIAGIGAGTNGVLLGVVTKFILWVNTLGMSLRLPASIAPLGFAFFSLSAISYLVDVYNGKFPAEKSFKSFLLYMIMFPKLFQGPLVRYEQLRLQIKERRSTEKAILDGAMRFATGLGKKVLIADFCGRMLQELAASGSDQALFGSWLRPVLLLFQVYYDFSACCDMAVGLGRILGFRIPENFRLPFMAMSVTEFLEGWNLTVRDFFRDYVYTPVVKSKISRGNKLIAGFAAVMLMSLWHGGTFNFWILGIYLSVVMLVEQQAQDFITDLPYWLRHVLTYLALIVCAVLFDNPDSASIAGALKAMIGEGGAVVLGDGTRFLNAVPLIALCWFGVSAEPKKLRSKWKTLCGVSKKAQKEQVHPIIPKVYAVSCLLYILVILWLCTIARVGAPAVESVFMGL